MARNVKIRKFTLYVADLIDSDLKDVDYQNLINQKILTQFNTHGFCHISEEKSKDIDASSFQNHPLNIPANLNNNEEWEKALKK